MFNTPKALVFSICAFISGSAFARSIHPCTPRVQAQPTYSICAQGGLAVEVRIDTLMSPQIEMCTGENYYEYQTANVKISFENGQAMEESTLFSGDFSYTLSPTGSATFVSEKLNLNLVQCVTPVNGAVSFGN